MGGGFGSRLVMRMMCDAYLLKSASVGSPGIDAQGNKECSELLLGGPVQVQQLARVSDGDVVPKLTEADRLDGEGNGLDPERGADAPRGR